MHRKLKVLYSAEQGDAHAARVLDAHTFVCR